MKPKNFPNRKQHRRSVAYEQLRARWINRTPNHSVNSEMASLSDSLAKGDLRSQRSKKSRAK